MFKKTETLITVTDVYPSLSSDQQKEAEYYIGRYLGVVMRIYDRVKRENPKLLTELAMRASLRKKESK